MIKSHKSKEPQIMVRAMRKKNIPLPDVYNKDSSYIFQMFSLATNILFQFLHICNFSLIFGDNKGNAASDRADRNFNYYLFDLRILQIK